MRRTLAVFLLAGTALLGAGAGLHPMLAANASATLGMIAASAHFRAIHLAMLAGSALVMTGAWVRIYNGPADAGRRFGPALGIIVVGFALNAYDMAFMASAGVGLASRFSAGNVGTVPLFDAMHAIGLMYARFGNFLVALGALLLGAAEWPTRQWSAILAWGAGIGGLVGVVAFPDTSRLILAAVALLSGWQVVTAIWGLKFKT